MKIEANVWQKVPGTPSVEIFPIIPKANCVSSNCYIFSAPDALVVVDPGASAEQTRQISRILTDALAVSRRPILVFLTHCHQDHSQEAGSLELPAGMEIKRFAHQAGVEALKHRDRNLTVAYLYPWNPEICTARFEGILFASSPASEPLALELADGGRIELYTEPIAMPDGATLQRQWLPLGAGNRLEIYHTPGHSPCSISLRVGSFLILGDLPFAANPGLCGLDGWNHADLLQTLTQCGLAPGNARHYRVLPRARLLRFGAKHAGEAPVDGGRSFQSDRRTTHGRRAHWRVSRSTLMNCWKKPRRCLRSFPGACTRCRTICPCWRKDSAASRVLTTLDIDQIDRILSDFRRIVESFNIQRHTRTDRGAQRAFRSPGHCNNFLSAEHVQQLLDFSLVGSGPATTGGLLERGARSSISPGRDNREP